MFCDFVTIYITLMFCILGTGAHFLKVPVTFRGPKPKFEIKTQRVVAWVLAHKPVHFVLLNDSFLVLNSIENL